MIPKRMLKILKKYGSTTVITLTPEELEILELKRGDQVEVRVKKIGRIDKIMEFSELPTGGN